MCAYKPLLLNLSTSSFRKIPPGLVEHVLTVLVFWSWVLLLHWLPPWPQRLRLFPCFTGPWTLLGSAACSSPTTLAKTGRTAHVFTAQGGTLRIFPKICFGDPKIEGFEKGLAGGGWRQTTPKKRPKNSPEMCPHSPKGA